MPAAPPPPPLPAPAHPPGGAPRPGPGHRGGLDHSFKYLSSRITERRLQSSCGPVGRGGHCGKAAGPAQRAVCPVFSPHGGFHQGPPENGASKPRVVTVVKAGGQPLRKITLLLNRRSVQTFEQLLADISEALGFPRWKNDRVRKLYSLKGKEVKSVSDFFREGDAFIAMGREPLTLKSIQTAMEELAAAKPRAPALPQHGWPPAPPKGGLCGKALKAERPPGEGEGAEAQGKAAGPEERPRPQHKRPPEQHAKPRPAQDGGVSGGGEKHRDSPLEKSSGEIVRCEKCRQERALRGGRPRPPELSLGSSELDLARAPRRDPGRLVRMRSCRGPLRGPAPAGEEVRWKGEGWRGRPRTPSPERPGKASEKRERRDADGHEHPEPPAARGRRDGGEAPGLPEGALREPRRGPRSVPRAGQSGWLLRERAQGPPRSPEEAAREARDPRGCPADEPKARAAGKKPRLAEAGKADVAAHYEVGKVIGDGNFAVVKECRHLGSRRAYAMKIVDKGKLRGKEDVVDSEIAIIRSLSHPNIVRLHEVYETAAEIYLILEYVRDGDLFDAIVENVKFSEREAAGMITDLCRALVHMHEHRIVHRDLKPENLLGQEPPLAASGKPCWLEEVKEAVEVVQEAGVVGEAGTRNAANRPGTRRSRASLSSCRARQGYGLEVDMWAAGVILYILLCGFPPFRSQDRDQEELFAIIQRGHFDFLSPYWDNISEGAKDLVRQLLVVDPKKRYTAHQVLEHPWIKAGGRASPVSPQSETTAASELPARSQGKGLPERGPGREGPALCL
ncbi:serine/threonine-protein kinase DCLK3 [Sarcophilus harrisii]|uniref:serine/threonine-protein kinase DCLK3 n=1 Tax=Sarcophilus harrisii TaxID=9305 RepID=UPI001301D75A|nr:serine/threonine-protein kinase DCLK3 [Sarcophilus harrisii]